MSYYDGPSWQGPGRSAPWEQPSTPSRSSTSSSVPREELNAFLGQFEEVERAIDNLSKSGKMFPAMGGRRESGGQMGGMGRGFSPNMGGPRQPPMEFDPMRSQSSSNLQNFYANQRFQPRHGDNDQMQQAKRRMAAQRERELRNYHQEQQYNRSVMAEMSTQGKSDRSNSPNPHEDDRRDLLARQHRALYGNDNFYEGNKFGEEGSTSRPLNQAAQPTGGRGPSPRAFNAFGPPDSAGNASGPASGNGGAPEDGAKGPSPKPTGPRSRSNSNSSPASANNPQNFALFETTANAQQSSRTSNSSPGGSPPRSGKGGAPAPIGTRPAHQALNKRATPPAASPLSFGFAPNESSNSGERAGSAASNPPPSGKEGSSGGASVGWGSGSGVWGQGKLGGVQASVWS